jgi:hypothetical protein
MAALLRRISLLLVPLLVEAVWKRGYRSAYGLLGFVVPYLGGGCGLWCRGRRRHAASSRIALIVFAMPSSVITRLKL